MLIKFVYDNREDLIIKRGTMTYHFNPTCEVTNEVHIKEFLALKPTTFVEVEKEEIKKMENACRYCNKECVDGRGKAAHERFCKENPDRKTRAKRK